MAPPDSIPRWPTSLSSLVLLIAATTPLATAATPPLTEHSKCGCFLTNGPEPQFFQFHDFWDFRGLTQSALVPTIRATPEANKAAPFTAKYFSSQLWEKKWITNFWDNQENRRPDATALMVMSRNNVYIEANADKSDSGPQTWLTLRTSRLKDPQTNKEFQTAAEIESFHKVKFASVRMLARTIGAPGAITALFTYRHADRLMDVQESDLEVRTRDEGSLIHYTNQPGYNDTGDAVEAASNNVTLPGGLRWTDWAVYRMDWTPGNSTWFVNDQEMLQKSFQAPRDDSKITLNAWSDGGRWSGNMSLGESAYLQVQWLELVYNSTEPGVGDFGGIHKRSGGGRLGERAEAAKNCTAVCSIDETPTTGQPVMLWGAGNGRREMMGGATGWIPYLVALGLLWVSAR